MPPKNSDPPPTSLNLSTTIARAQDGMILVSNVEQRQEAREVKALLKTLTSRPAPLRCTIDAPIRPFHYIIERPLLIMCSAEKGYPRKLAFAYLEELQQAFAKHYQHNEILAFARPYAAVNFDPTMQRIRREYLDPNTPANTKKLTSQLAEIHTIMSQNIQEVMQRGERLEDMESRSSALLQESKKFERTSKYANLQAYWKQMVPLIAIGLVIALVLYWRLLR